jgi:hypothetical protein
MPPRLMQQQNMQQVTLLHTAAQTLLAGQYTLLA